MDKFEKRTLYLESDMIGYFRYTLRKKGAKRVLLSNIWNPLWFLRTTKSSEGTLGTFIGSLCTL